MQGNKLTLLGGDQNSKATLNTDIWTKLNLRWRNQTTFLAFTSASCRVKLTQDKFVLMGGLPNDKKDAVTTVLKIDLQEETVEELPPMKFGRVQHSCQILELAGEEVILVSGGTWSRPSPAGSQLAIQRDEIYYLTGKTEPKVLSEAASLGRYQHKLLRLGDSVFAAGGKDRTKVQPSVVRVFNVDAQRWEDSSEHLKSGETGEVAVTPFPLTAVDCVEGCQCGKASSGTASSRVVGGHGVKVKLLLF